MAQGTPSRGQKSVSSRAIALVVGGYRHQPKPSDEVTHHDQGVSQSRNSHRVWRWRNTFRRESVSMRGGAQGCPMLPSSGTSRPRPVGETLPIPGQDGHDLVPYVAASSVCAIRSNRGGDPLGTRATQAGILSPSSTLLLQTGAGDDQRRGQLLQNGLNRPTRVAPQGIEDYRPVGTSGHRHLDEPYRKRHGSR